MRRAIELAVVAVWTLCVYIVAGAILDPELWGGLLGAAAAIALFGLVVLSPLLLLGAVVLAVRWYRRRGAPEG